MEVDSQQERESSKQTSKPASPAYADTPVSEVNWQEESAWVDDSAKIDGRTSISTARSLEEAKWLQRHGFLTRSKIDYLRGLGFTEVERLARAGNRDAILFLGEQFIKDGRGDLIVGALDKLIDREASIPALHLRARYKTSRVTEVPGDLPTDSWQWRDAAFASSDAKIDVASDYFAAYLLGDYRGSQIATKMFAYEKNGLPPVVYTNAARLVAGMSQSGRPITLDPRPMPDEARGANDF
ncbi:hypothetical protein GCM10010080_27020 [Thermomonas carbonis]|nr:hypothetical protein GCM10010080_27020 [Thermomonas carbonis]